MNHHTVKELLAGHGEGKLVLSHRIHGTDFEVMVSMLQASGNTFVREYCARAPILAGTDGLGHAAAKTFKAVHTAIEGDLRAKPADLSLFQFVSDPSRRSVFFRPFD
jgi:hypothetical protein